MCGVCEGMHERRLMLVALEVHHMNYTLRIHQNLLCTRWRSHSIYFLYKYSREPRHKTTPDSYVVKFE